MARQKKYIWAKGKRKEARATVRLFEGKGAFTVNGQLIEKYFPGEAFSAIYRQPLVAGKCEGKFWGRFVVKGGGKKGQAEAVRLALARALVKYNPEVYRPLMREAGLLTVDARVRERRKAGQMGRARKKKQSPKR
ncbi:30S ribosomal protein S9 [bacterium]|nr:30S ribosomal protein S9 [bacterium]